MATDSVTTRERIDHLEELLSTGSKMSTIDGNQHVFRSREEIVAEINRLQKKLPGGKSRRPVVSRIGLGG